MRSKNKGIAFLAIFAFALLAGAGFIVDRRISATVNQTSVEICDNGIDDNNDGVTDGCWDPGNNYQASGTKYYVSKTGNDENDGSQSRPFKTINAATSKAVAGDGIFVSPGTYEEAVQFANAGTPQKPILLKGIGSKGSIVVRRADDYKMITPKSNTIIENIKTDGIQTVTDEGHGIGGYGFFLSDVENIMIKDCIMTQHEKGIRAEFGKRLIVRDSLIKDCEWGTYIGTDNEDGFSPEFQDTLWENVEAADSAWTEYYNTDGFLVEGYSAYHVFRNCSAHGWADGGFDLKAHVLVENSKSYNNKWTNGKDSNGIGFKIWRDGTVRNSIAYNNTIANYLYGGYRPDWKMVGNISYNGDVVFEKRAESDPNLSSSTIKLSHNIFYNTRIKDEIGDAFRYADHNLFFGGDVPAVKGSAALSADPKLKNIGSYDFHLQSDSPAIDAGLATVSTMIGPTDFDGNPRKSGQAIDIGPFEFVQTGVTSATSPSPTIATSSTVPVASRTAVRSVTPTPTPTPDSSPVTIKGIQFESIPPKVVTAGGLLSFRVQVKNNSGPVTFRKVAVPQGSKLGSESGTFAWRPSIFTSGSYNAQVKATDAKGNSSIVSFDIKVLRRLTSRENRTINVENKQGSAISYQVCRNSNYTDKYQEVFTFSDGSPMKYITESGRSACSNFYLHNYVARGEYLLTLYLCELKDGKIANCFPNAAVNISK